MGIKKGWMLLLGALVLWAAPAWASPGGATQFMQARQAAVNKVLSRHQGEKAGDALSREIDALLDYEALSRHALAGHWEERTPQEREQFVSLLKQLVERNYRKNLRSTLGYKIEYLGEERGDLGTVVRTSAKSKKNRREPAVAIDYTLHREDDGTWRVLDITTDGVSMVRNYRSQFNRILRDEGWDDLIRRMQQRLENEGHDV